MLFARPLKPAPRSVVGWAVLSVAVASVLGCEDKASSDKEVVSKLREGIAKVAALPDLQAGDPLTTATNDLAAATNEKNADPAYLAVAGGAVAELDLQAASAGTLKLKQAETAVRRTLVQLRRLGDTLAASAAYADALGKADPKDAVQTLTASISSMQGNAQANTWGGDGSSLPTLAAAKAEKAKLDGEISDTQSQIADLQKQRTDALATADQQSAHADQLKGDEAVKAYADAAESRKNGENLGIKIDLLQAKLTGLQADAALQEGQATTVSNGVQTLEKQGQDLQTNWGQIQKHAESQKAIATAIVEGDEQAKTSIKQVAGELKKQVDDLARIRTTVLDQLKEAEKYAQDANNQASTFERSIATQRTAPGKSAEAYKSLRDTVNPQKFAYQAALAEREMGGVSTSQAELLSEVQAVVDGVKSSVQAAGVNSPAELDVDTSAAKTLTDGAKDSYKSAIDAFSNVEAGDAPETLKNAAKSAKLIAYFGQLKLFDLQAAAGQADAKNNATQAMSDAMQVKADLQAANVPLPALPGPLGEPTPPATQPTT